VKNRFQTLLSTATCATKQWSVPQHDLPAALLTAVAALAGGRGAMGSTRATAGRASQANNSAHVIARVEDPRFMS